MMQDSETKETPCAAAQAAQTAQTDQPKCIGDEGVLSVVAPILLGKRFNEVMQENDRLKKKLAVLERVIHDKCDYANDLVWFARADPGRGSSTKHIQEVEQQHPQHVEAYHAAPDWQHGYNSACLALSRLLLDILHAEQAVADLNAQVEEDDPEAEPMTVADYVEQALEEYPFLDT